MVHGAEWSFFGMHFVWWFIWMAIILGAFTTYTPIPKSQLKTGELALDILRRRYAAGQITTEEYERRKVVLERDEPASASPTAAHQHH